MMKMCFEFYSFNVSFSIESDTSLLLVTFSNGSFLTALSTTPCASGCPDHALLQT